MTAICSYSRRRRRFLATRRPRNHNLEKVNSSIFKSFEDRYSHNWPECSLRDYCVDIIRGNIPEYVKEGGVPILNQKVNKGSILDTQYYKFNSPSALVIEEKFSRKGDVLLNSLGQGTLGRVHLYISDSKVIIDQFITILRTSSFTKSAYLAYKLCSPEYQMIIENSVTGSTGMWVLTINNIRKLKIHCPTDSDFNVISGIIDNNCAQMARNVSENYNLGVLRDSLLPKLFQTDTSY